MCRHIVYIDKYMLHVFFNVLPSVWNHLHGWIQSIKTVLAMFIGCLYRESRLFEWLMFGMFKKNSIPYNSNNNRTAICSCVVYLYSYLYIYIYIQNIHVWFHCGNLFVCESTQDVSTKDQHSANGYLVVWDSRGKVSFPFIRDPMNLNHQFTVTLVSGGALKWKSKIGVW